MVDDGVGRTATKHRMTKRMRQGVAQSGSTVHSWMGKSQNPASPWVLWGRGATGEGQGNDTLSPDSLAGGEGLTGRAATGGRSRAAFSA
jgi:hypothetical protein